MRVAWREGVVFFLLRKAISPPAVTITTGYRQGEESQKTFLLWLQDSKHYGDCSGTTVITKLEVYKNKCKNRGQGLRGNSSSMDNLNKWPFCHF